MIRDSAVSPEVSADLFRLLAPAKINLFLHVLGKRDDGYHELETWMYKLPFHDILDVRLTDREGISLSCSDPALSSGEDNLVYRAADLFFAESERAKGRGLEIHLEKNIPVAAGLGGGSSDAGTLLKGLNAFFAHEFSREQLLDLAGRLGADVPFFISDDISTLASGVGEIMRPAPLLPACSVVLGNPGVPLSTAEVFRKFALTKASTKSIMSDFCADSHAPFRLSGLKNDLEQVSCTLLPVITEMKGELARAGADVVLMSGSGPTVFAIFRHSEGRGEKYAAGVAALMRRHFGDNAFAVSLSVGV